jgi:hypothetical protein
MSGTARALLLFVPCVWRGEALFVRRMREEEAELLLLLPLHCHLRRSGWG